MTTFQHAAHGVLFAAIFTANPLLIFLSALLGAYKDILGELGKWYKLPINDHPHRNKDDWDMYLWAHRWHWIDWFPPCAAHYWIDRAFHRPTGGWKSWGIYVEIIGWILIVALLILL
jgi:hypothetical protein